MLNQCIQIKYHRLKNSTEYLNNIIYSNITQLQQILLLQKLLCNCFDECKIDVHLRNCIVCIAVLN